MMHRSSRTMAFLAAPALFACAPPSRGGADASPVDSGRPDAGAVEPASPWARGLGGPLIEGGHDVAVDPAGDIYVVYFFERAPEDAGACPVGSTVAKLGRAGDLKWARSSNADECVGAYVVAAVGTDGLVVAGLVMGKTDLGGEPVTASDLGWPFLLRLDADGNPRWSSLGRAGQVAVPWRVSATAEGRIALVGFYDHDLDLGAGPLPSAPMHRAFAAMYDPDGEVRWSRAFGGPLQSYFYGSALTAGGDLVAGGSFRGELALGATTLVSSGAPDSIEYDGVLVRLDGGDGAPAWAVQAPCPAGATFTSVAIAEDALFAAGHAAGEVALGGAPLDFTGYGTFAARYDLDGAHRWSVAAAEHGDGYGLASLAAGRQVLVGGGFAGRARLGAADAIAAGQVDGYLIALRPEDGQFSSTWLVIGPESDWVRALAADDEAWIAAGGFSRTADIAGLPLTAAGETDAFVVRGAWPAEPGPEVP